MAIYKYAFGSKPKKYAYGSVAPSGSQGRDHRAGRQARNFFAGMVGKAPATNEAIRGDEERSQEMARAGRHTFSSIAGIFGAAGDAGGGEATPNARALDQDQQQVLGNIPGQNQGNNLGLDNTQITADAQFTGDLKTSPNNNADWDTMGQNPNADTERPFFFKKGSKPSLYEMGSVPSDQGHITGKKKDRQPMKANEGMIIPKQYVQAFLNSQEAKVLGIDPNVKADMSQPGGENIRVSDGEYYIDQATIDLAEKVLPQGAGQLQKFAPDATESIGEGVSAFDGTQASLLGDRDRDLNFNYNDPSTRGAVFNHFRRNNPDQPGGGQPGGANYLDQGGKAYYNQEGGLYVKDPDKGGVDGLNTAKSIYDSAVSLGMIFKNPKYQPIAKYQESFPELYDDSVDTSAIEESLARGHNKILATSKDLGYSPHQIINRAYPKMLAQKQQLGQNKLNMETDLRNKNKDVINAYKTRGADKRFQRNVINRQMHDQFQREKGAMRTQGLVNLSQIMADNQQRKLDNRMLSLYERAFPDTKKVK